MNFLDPQYQTSLKNSVEFGLCDDQDGAAAYVDTKNREKWIATIESEIKARFFRLYKFRLDLQSEIKFL